MQTVLIGATLRSGLQVEQTPLAQWDSFDPDALHELQHSNQGALAPEHPELRYALPPAPSAAATLPPEPQPEPELELEPEPEPEPQPAVVPAPLSMSSEDHAGNGRSRTLPQRSTSPPPPARAVAKTASGGAASDGPFVTRAVAKPVAKALPALRSRQSSATPTAQVRHAPLLLLHGRRGSHAWTRVRPR